MRVAHVLRKYNLDEWGGTETALARLVAGLRNQAVDSVVFCPRLHPDRLGALSSPNGETAGNGSGEARRDRSDPLIEAGATVRRFSAVVPIIGISAQAKRQMLAVGGNLLSFELPRMLAHEPDLAVVHSHTLGRLGGLALTIARRRHIPFVVTVHGGVLDLPPALKQDLNQAGHGGFEWGRFFGWWWRAREVLSDADAILTCNAREAGMLGELLPRRRIVAQPHGVPMKLYQRDCRAAAREAFPQIGGRQLLLCPGRIDPVKNQGWLLGQADEFLAVHPESILMLVGPCTDEDYGASLQSRLRDSGLGGRIFMTGGLPPGDPRLIGLLQEARAIVLPSISETFGLVILEAWAAGTPVLSSRTSGASALIQHGKNGWLFDLDDPLSFHAALNRVLHSGSSNWDVVAAGRRTVANQYDTDALAGQVQRLYAELVEEKNALRHPAGR